MKLSILITLSRSECIHVIKGSLVNVMEEIEKHEQLECHEMILMVDNSRIGRSEILAIGPYDFKVVHTRNGEPPRGNAQMRRDRIASMRNLSREHVSKETDFVFSFEDDTSVPRKALSTLVASFNKFDNVGIISGIQVGRWGRKYIGAWHADNLQFPEEVASLDPRETGSISSVDGTGFYCFLTPTKLYKAARFGWFEPLGPDAFYGFGLRMQGYNNYVDRRVICGHYSPKGEILPGKDTVQLKVHKDRPNRWKIETVKR